MKKNFDYFKHFSSLINNTDRFPESFLKQKAVTSKIKDFLLGLDGFIKVDGWFQTFDEDEVEFLNLNQVFLSNLSAAKKQLLRAANSADLLNFTATSISPFDDLSIKISKNIFFSPLHNINMEELTIKILAFNSGNRISQARIYIDPADKSLTLEISSYINLSTPQDVIESIILAHTSQVFHLAYELLFQHGKSLRGFWDSIHIQEASDEDIKRIYIAPSKEMDSKDYKSKCSDFFKSLDFNIQTTKDGMALFIDEVITFKDYDLPISTIISFTSLPHSISFFSSFSNSHIPTKALDPLYNYLNTTGWVSHGGQSIELHRLPDIGCASWITSNFETDYNFELVLAEYRNLLGFIAYNLEVAKLNEEIPVEQH